jgi:hypothetical protein
MRIFYLSHSVLLKMKNALDESCRENQNTHFNFFFENRAVYEIMWKKFVQSDRLYNGAWALHAGYPRLQTHTQNMYLYRFSIATMVKRTRLNVTLYVHCLSSTENQYQH